MTNEEVIRRILEHKRVHSLNEPRAVLINEALDLAIKALETGEVYMTGKDYNLYMEGYKAGKKDFEPKQGEWICHSDNYITFYTCNRCNGFGYADDNFCNNCGAKMKGGKEE